MKRSCLTRRLAVTVSLAIATLLVVGLLAPGSEAAITWKKQVGDKEIKVNFYGFAQFEARAGDGLPINDGIRFSAQRIRLGSSYFHGPVFAKLFLDFNQPFDRTGSDPGSGGIPRMIKDAFVGYKWNNAAFIKVGMMKTPLGMNFTIPGWNLDNIERSGLDKGLVLERDFGLMLSGRLIGGPKDQKMKVNGTEMGHERWGKGFGYDIGVFNPAGRSSAVKWNPAVLGDALAYVGRIHYDHTTKLHTELSYAVSEQAGEPVDEGEPETLDYKVMDFGLNSFILKDRFNIKFEYIMGESIFGTEGRDQDTFSLALGYRVVKTFELILKHYQASATRDDSATTADTDLGNTYFGFSWYLAPLQDKPRTLQNHRIQFNYVFTSGDDDGDWTGRGGYQDVVYLAQYQYKF